MSAARKPENGPLRVPQVHVLSKAKDTRASSSDESDRACPGVPRTSAQAEVET